MKYKIDSEAIRKDVMMVNGWAVGETLAEELRFSLTDSQGKSVEFTLVRQDREDIVRMMQEEDPVRNAKSADGEEYLPGFCVQFVFDPDEVYLLEVSGENGTRHAHLRPKRLRENKGRENTWMVRMQRYLNLDRLEDFKEYLKEKGLRSFFQKAGEKIQDEGVSYDKWYQTWHETEESLQKRNLALQDIIREPDERPYFRIVLTGKAGHGAFQEMMESLTGQVYTGYQIKPPASRVRVDSQEAGLAFCLFVRKDSVLTPGALLYMAEEVSRNPDTDLIYGDEDRMTGKQGKKCMPFFKPDFNWTLLRSTNYLGNLLAVREDLLETLQEREFPDGLSYDQVLRLCEKAGHIAHIPHVLVHERYRGEQISYHEAYTDEQCEAEMQALRDHYARVGIEAEVERGVAPGIYRTKRKVHGNPLVSILIPSKDHKEDLELLLSSLHERSSYRAFEVIVIENNSTDPETFTYYEEAKKKYPWLRVIVWESGFNYAAINNFGAAHAKGDYLLFMNNDMELKSPDLLTEMLGYCQEADVGMVGARLLYPDDTIQHAGVFIGMSGLADHGFQGFSGRETGYHYRPLMAQELSAVTAACLMMKKETFFQVEGFDEAYRVAFNDTDLCMKVRAAGLRIIYTPEAVMYHYESKSRGLEDTPEKKARLKGEVDRFKEKWPEILENGDPFYNPNLTTKKQDFSLK